ncbi:MAG: anti-phage dCTP deaminase, partial [Bosea sp. (in: a-proteobacteria)]
MLTIEKLNYTRRKNASIHNPELVFGIVGPIGVNIDSVVDALKDGLRTVQYESHVIHLTDFIEDDRIDIIIDKNSYFKKYESLIAYGNAFRSLAKTSSALAGVAVARIREIRKSTKGNADQPALGNAYIIRQFKRPEEIELMRRTYGRKFVQISVYANEHDRRAALIKKIKAYNSAPKIDSDCEREAISLISMDQNQSSEEHGQRLGDVFHLGDVFVSGIEREKIRNTILKFVNA